jgi:hypothetical protein
VYLRLADRIGVDIMQGRFAPGQVLMSNKVLSARYGVNRRTLVKALDELTDRRVIETLGRRCRVAGAQPRPGYGMMWLVTATGEDGAVSTTGPRTEQLIVALERCCGRASCRMEVLGYDRQMARFRPSAAAVQALHSGLTGPPPLGFAVLNNMDWGRTPTRETNLLRVLKQLLPLGRPVSLIDEGGGIDVSGALYKSRTMRCLRTASLTAGEAAGRFLIERGHRCVAYLSAVHGSDWSRQRLDGLVKAFSAAGLGDGVVCCVHVKASTPRDYQTREFDFSPHRVKLLTPLLRDDPDHPDSLVARTLIEMPSNTLLLPRELVVLQKPVRELAARALDCAGVTAWVAAHDVEAFICQDFLKEQGVAVPDQVSLVGFDNMPEAFTRGITSYDFNVDALAAAAVNHVLELPLMERHGAAAPIDIEGWFVERGSLHSLAVRAAVNP